MNDERVKVLFISMKFAHETESLFQEPYLSCRKREDGADYAYITLPIYDVEEAR